MNCFARYSIALLVQDFAQIFIVIFWQKWHSEKTLLISKTKSNNAKLCLSYSTKITHLSISQSLKLWLFLSVYILLQRVPYTKDIQFMRILVFLRCSLFVVSQIDGRTLKANKFNNKSILLKQFLFNHQSPIERLYNLMKIQGYFIIVGQTYREW